jgi:hypothetical protein
VVVAVDAIEIAVVIGIETVDALVNQIFDHDVTEKNALAVDVTAVTEKPQILSME